MSTTRLSEQPLIHATAYVENVRLGRYTEIGARTSLTNAQLGDYSYIVEDGEIANAVIGKFCSIARAVRINPGNHPMWRASQSHFTYRASWYFEDESDDAAFFTWRNAHSVSIGHDVWIGHGAVILPGVKAGTGAVIGAGAVVTKDVPDYMIVAGVPAKPIRLRFAEKTAAALQAIAWWDWSHEQLRVALPDFRTLPIEAFVEKYALSAQGIS